MAEAEGGLSLAHVLESCPSIQTERNACIRSLWESFSPSIRALLPAPDADDPHHEWLLWSLYLNPPDELFRDPATGPRLHRLWHTPSWAAASTSPTARDLVRAHRALHRGMGRFLSTIVTRACVKLGVPAPDALDAPWRSRGRLGRHGGGCTSAKTSMALTEATSATAAHTTPC